MTRARHTPMGPLTRQYKSSSSLPIFPTDVCLLLYNTLLFGFPIFTISCLPSPKETNSLFNSRLRVSVTTNSSQNLRKRSETVGSSPGGPFPFQVRYSVPTSSQSLDPDRQTYRPYGHTTHPHTTLLTVLFSDPPPSPRLSTVHPRFIGVL